MVPHRASLAAFALVAAAALSIPAPGQSAGERVTGQSPAPRIKITSPKSQSALFPWNSLNAQSPSYIEFRSPDRMTEQDRSLEMDAEASIAERAEASGMDFNRGKWNSRQIVCTALPNHLLLRFTRDQGPGDVSEFSISIPRYGKGRAWIIPIERRGYSPFSPAPVNPRTIAIFNRIRGEEPAGETPGWLNISLCYAALAGADPRSGEPNGASGGSAPPPTLRTLESGAVVRFTDVAARPRPIEWSLTFDDKGNLLKTACTRAPAAGAKHKNHL